MAPTLHHEELRAWLRLTLEPGLGPVQARSLLAAIGLPQDIYNASLATLEKLLPPALARQLRQDPAPDMLDRIEHSLQWLEQPGRHIVTLADPEYPRALLDTWDPPPVLYAHGNLSLLARPCLGIVGARSATPGGADNGRAFARHLAEQGWCIVSGLAQGIDAAAHAGALQAGPESGGTIAVLGTGIDIVYPAANRDLAHHIARDGLMISELPLGTRALPHQFPRRNRLVAGMCRGILVVEAARQSGSLITARLAAELGREVFAIPGSIHSPLARGCHALIRQGAKLVESGDDIHEELSRPVQGQLPVDHTRAGRKGGASASSMAGDVTRKPAGITQHNDRSRNGQQAQKPEASPDKAAETRFDADGRAVLHALGHDPAHSDTLQERTGFPIARLSAALLELELAAAVHRLADGRYQRA